MKMGMRFSQPDKMSSTSRMQQTTVESMRVSAFFMADSHKLGCVCIYRYADDACMYDDRRGSPPSPSFNRYHEVGRHH